MSRTVVLSVVLVVSGCPQHPAVAPCEEALADQVVVFAAWHHEQVTTVNEAAGLDLDRVVSDGTAEGCTGELDYTSWRRGTSGVDNQYAANLLPLLESSYPDGIDAAVLRQLMGGESVLGLDVRVGPERELVVSLVELAPADPMTADASGRALSPGQRFHVVRAERVAARCTGDDEMELSWPTLDLPMGDPIVAVPLRGVRLRVDVGPTGALAGGELGARYPLPFVVEVAEILGRVIDEETARSVAHPDLDPTADPNVCESVSFGVGFELTSATLVP